MRREVVFRPQAEDDVLEVRAWYETRHEGLGRKFGQALDALVTGIADNPLLYQRVHGDTRRAVLSRFPYSVYFRSTEAHVVVLATHGRQHESHWQERS